MHVTHGLNQFIRVTRFENISIRAGLQDRNYIGIVIIRSENQNTHLR